MRKTFIAVALVAIVALVAGPALAGKPQGAGGKPSGSSTATLNLSPMDGATEARHGGRITFEVRTTATNEPFVGLRCWQGTTWVYDGYVGYFEGAMFDHWFVLDGLYWQDGEPASCTARLFSYDRRGNEKLIKTLTFPVAP